MLGLNIAGMSNFSFLICHYSCFACVQIRHNPLSGGYCGGVPPLPIPNREVKPTCADDTAMQCGRVGRRLLSMKSLRFRKISEAFLFFFPRIFFFSAGVIFYSGGSFTSDLFFIGFHGWIGRQSCLSDYSRISADIWPLANGSRQKWAPIFFTQISQMTQIFSHWLFKSHRFHGFTQIFSHWLFCPTDFTDLRRFFLIDYLSPTDFTDFRRVFWFFLFLNFY